MCRLFIRRQDNHKVATATRAKKQQFWQANDVVQGQNDADYVGPGDVATFDIVEMPGVDLSLFANLLVGTDTARRVNQLDRATLRTKLTTGERDGLDRGRATLADGARKVNESTVVRPT